MTQFDDIRNNYNITRKNIENLAEKDWKNLSYNKLIEILNEFQSLIKELNKQKRGFLRYSLIEDNELAKKLFVASDSFIQSSIIDHIDPIIEKISEKRDKRLYFRGILWGAIISIILSILSQIGYDYFSISEYINPPEITNQSIDSIVKKNNLLMIDSLKKENILLMDSLKKNHIDIRNEIDVNKKEIITIIKRNCKK